MNLASALSPLSSGNTRSRGVDYYRSGAVVHFDPQASLVYAVVRGGDDYVVRLELAGHSVRAACTCPAFDDRREPCKHIWAVALRCDAEHVLQPRDVIGRARVEFEPVPFDDTPDRARWIESVEDPEFASPGGVRAGRTAAPRPRPVSWEQALAAVEESARLLEVHAAAAPGRILYVVDLAASRSSGTLFVYLCRQEQKQNGDWGAAKPAHIQLSHVRSLPEPDRAILERLRGAQSAYSWETSGSYAEVPSPFHLSGSILHDLLPAMCATGRFLLALTTFPTPRPQDAELVPVSWDEGEPFACSLRVDRDDVAGRYGIDGALLRGDAAVALADIHLMLDDGVALAGRRAFRFTAGPLLAWMRQLRERGPIVVPLSEAARLREAFIRSGVPDADGLPEELRTDTVDAEPVPHLSMESQPHAARYMLAVLGFSYDGGPAAPPPDGGLAPTHDPRIMARRSPAAEQRAHDRLRSLGARPMWNTWAQRSVPHIPVAEVPRIVRTLVSEGWHVQADGHRYRLATEPPDLQIRSGIDWFELHGDVAFDDQRVGLPALLAAIDRRNGAVVLKDGSYGILPDAWVRDLAPLAIARRDGDHLRFTRAQVALFDALLGSRPAVSWDASALAARERLRATDAIAPEDPPPTFAGTLRAYQREALGWLTFLRASELGGCLADDMGLGKTVVVLALLDARRQAREAGGSGPHPSLVVVPRSVLFNWEQEAARFAPGLRVLDFSGADRLARTHLIAEHDLVLVTYGTLRRDAPALVEHEFDYVILDEAQTIKNANTAGAKAARLLRGRHRLALSGTPVENRLADLWSLFEFLNPGLLSGSTAFARAFSSTADAEQLRLLARGLRPFILRRTKEQVASELPARTEQTIVCELERPQRVLYDELRDHYRRQLLGGGVSWERSKLQVLEALLRLRQAACHPGLVDPARATDASAKLDLLVPRLLETIDEGHKALVFSQFTSFLALLRARLDADGVAYEYLDGRTRDRAARIQRFQSDQECRLFLISLKAGGVGLNLTAADYVFILDPWWNPAAEAQAIDRTHRIGQTRSVFAYRLIARDTVEERVVELQQRKRELADAIITADNSVVRALQREDLELLLS